MHISSTYEDSSEGLLESFFLGPPLGVLGPILSKKSFYISTIKKHEILRKYQNTVPGVFPRGLPDIRSCASLEWARQDLKLCIRGLSFSGDS